MIVKRVSAALDTTSLSSTLVMSWSQNNCCSSDALFVSQDCCLSSVLEVFHGFGYKATGACICLVV